MSHTVLIAEGDAKMSDLYRRFLLLRGYEVETASGGLECVEKLRRIRPDVLVLNRELHWGGCEGVMAWLREEFDMDGVGVVLTDKAAFFPHVALGVEVIDEDMQAMPYALTALEDSVRAAISFKRPGREPVNGHVNEPAEPFARGHALAC